MGLLFIFPHRHMVSPQWHLSSVFPHTGPGQTKPLIPALPADASAFLLNLICLLQPQRTSLHQPLSPASRGSAAVSSPVLCLSSPPPPSSWYLAHSFSILFISFPFPPPARPDLGGGESHITHSLISLPGPPPQTKTL